VTPFVEHIIQQRYTPQRLFARGRKSVREALEVVADLPRDLRHLLRVTCGGAGEDRSRP